MGRAAPPPPHALRDRLSLRFPFLDDAQGRTVLCDGMSNREQIRNLAIVAHIDHGKSTLADRLLEITGTVEKRKLKAQMLDVMDLEREKGITIKLTPVRMDYRPEQSEMGGGQSAGRGDAARRPNPFILNLIDTPGHVDFGYEVSRSLAAVEGVILLVDATQGVQAQTLAHLEAAKQQRKAILPAVNKIDVPHADTEGTARDVSALTGVPPAEVLRVSAKTGEGVPQLLQAIISRVPPPAPPTGSAFRALIFDSVFDAYQGVIVYVRVMDGSVATGEAIAFAASGASATALTVGTFRPDPTPGKRLDAGEIGFVATGLRNAALARVGDTLIHRSEQGSVSSVPGYAVPQPNVYAGLYPTAGEGFPALRAALDKFRLSDAALTAEAESSPALGQGFRCGFLGLLHLEIVRERLKREYGVDVTLTVPSVAYGVVLKTHDAQRVTRLVRSAAEFPDPSSIEGVEEPWTAVTVFARAQDIGSVLSLFAARLGGAPVTESLTGGRVSITAALPLREVIVGFHDDLKAATSGYGSFSLQPAGMRPVELVKLSVLVNHEPVEALSVLVPAAQAATRGREIVQRLRDAMPRQLFAVPLQAAIGGKIIARETIPALRKDVTGYLYGGDVTRKRKLLEKQKKGKKKLAARGRVDIPPSAYLAVLQPGGSTRV